MLCALNYYLEYHSLKMHLPLFKAMQRLFFVNISTVSIFQVKLLNSEITSTFHNNGGVFISNIQDVFGLFYFKEHFFKKMINGEHIVVKR